MFKHSYLKCQHVTVLGQKNSIRFHGNFTDKRFVNGNVSTIYGTFGKLQISVILSLVVVISSFFNILCLVLFYYYNNDYFCYEFVFFSLKLFHSRHIRIMGNVAL